MEIHFMKIRRTWNRLIFATGIPQLRVQICLLIRPFMASLYLTNSVVFPEWIFFRLMVNHKMSTLDKLSLQLSAQVHTTLQCFSSLPIPILVAFGGPWRVVAKPLYPLPMLLSNKEAAWSWDILNEECILYFLYNWIGCSERCDFHMLTLYWKTLNMCTQCTIPLQNPGITHFEAFLAGCTLDYGDGKHDRPCGPSVPEEAISKSVLLN